MVSCRSTDIPLARTLTPEGGRVPPTPDGWKRPATIDARASARQRCGVLPPSPGSAAAPISLAYSADADDAFMFHAIRAGLIDTRGFSFTHWRGDTAALNRLALGEKPGGADGAGGDAEVVADVVAISAGVYPRVAARYQLLPHGASVGRGFGPVVVARRPVDAAGLAGLRVGIPGLTTTAWLVLRLIQPAALPVEIPIVPFARIFEALEAGEVDAALLIHEGRLLYRDRGLHKVAPRRSIATTVAAHADLGAETSPAVFRESIQTSRLA